MFPHERSLVAKMKDEPFALIGVNSDRDFAEKKKKEFIEEKITWRSFSCGEQGTMGEIPSNWGVTGWPTLYLIDADGRIQQKWIGGQDGETLEKAIEPLVAKAKAGAKAPPAKKAGAPR
jgi:hypothetical protein